MSLSQIDDGSLLETIIERSVILAPHGGWIQCEHRFANVAGAARLLGITRPQLQYRLKRNRG